jgi:hypothetical protein
MQLHSTAFSAFLPDIRESISIEVINLTIGMKVQQTLASAESVMANLKTFALETQDQNAKKMFNDLAQSQQEIVNSLKGRLQFIQQEEPQYKNI